MSTDESSRLLPVLAPTTELEKSISSLNQPLADFLVGVGLPIENVLSPIAERRKVISDLETALSILPQEDREKAFYLTKFTVAISVGLFDGALNYLWNETIEALRRLVGKFDLAYFFSVAEKISSRYKNLSSSDDLDQIQDHDLLEACRRIGFISDVNYKRLENVDYMRNHASAAHPNDVEIDGFEMLGWLTNCLRYAIIAQPDHSVILVNVLLSNIRSTVIPPEDFAAIGSEVEKLPQERIDDLLWTLFGMHVDPKQSTTAKSNIGSLASAVWNASSEDRKYEIGARYGVFRKNAEVQRKESAEHFLQLVGGNNYKDEDSLAGELLEKLETLKSVHYGMNNFYNEYAHAKILGDSLPVNGAVPRAARPTWVKVICICYIGNGHGYREGVDESAVRYYTAHIENFSEAEIVRFLNWMGDAEFTSAIDRTKPDERVRQLANILKSKSENVHIQKALDLIISAPQGKLDTVSGTVDYKNALKFVPKHN